MSGQNGKGSRPRNNWGPKWNQNFDSIDWKRKSQNTRGSSTPNGAKEQETKSQAV
jgi:hypothetical protein